MLHGYLTFAGKRLDEFVQRGLDWRIAKGCCIRMLLAIASSDGLKLLLKMLLQFVDVG